MESASTPPEPPPPAPEPTAAPAPYDPASVLAQYPAQADVVWQEEYSRFMPLVKWLLLVPHYIVLFFLFIGMAFALLFAAFAVLFTRRYPRGLFDYVVGVYRWGWRVCAYLFLMTDRYPPFSLEEDPEYPTELEIPYPEEVDRWRPFVQWFLAIPYLFIGNILQNLAQLLVFFAFFTILFTKRFPQGMFHLLLVSMRWNLRGNAYAHFLVTRYPPFAWG